MSKGLEKRRAAEEEHRTARPDFPPLCSPKSMYRLADIVRFLASHSLRTLTGNRQFALPTLKQAAEKEIQAQLSSAIIAHELFSPLTAKYATCRSHDFGVFMHFPDIPTYSRHSLPIYTRTGSACL